MLRETGSPSAVFIRASQVIVCALIKTHSTRTHARTAKASQLNVSSVRRCGRFHCARMRYVNTLPCECDQLLGVAGNMTCECACINKSNGHTNTGGGGGVREVFMLGNIAVHAINRTRVLIEIDCWKLSDAEATSTTATQRRQRSAITAASTPLHDAKYVRKCASCRACKHACMRMLRCALHRMQIVRDTRCRRRARSLAHCARN